MATFHRIPQWNPLWPQENSLAKNAAVLQMRHSTEVRVVLHLIELTGRAVGGKNPLFWMQARNRSLTLHAPTPSSVLGARRLRSRQGNPPQDRFDGS